MLIEGQESCHVNDQPSAMSRFLVIGATYHTPKGTWLQYLSKLLANRRYSRVKSISPYALKRRLAGAQNRQLPRVSQQHSGWAPELTVLLEEATGGEVGGEDAQREVLDAGIW